MSHTAPVRDLLTSVLEIPDTPPPSLAQYWEALRVPRVCIGRLVCDELSLVKTELVADGPRSVVSLRELIRRVESRARSERLPEADTGHLAVELATHAERTDEEIARARQTAEAAWRGHVEDFLGLGYYSIPPDLRYIRDQLAHDEYHIAKQLVEVEAEMPLFDQMSLAHALMFSSDRRDVPRRRAEYIVREVCLIVSRS